MAKIETWFTCDLHGPVQVHTLDNDLFNQDSLGNVIGVRVYSKGEPVTLSGSVNGYIVRSDGVTVPVAGTRSGNRAYITMPSSAYAVVGVVQIVIKLTEGSSITTLAACVGYMHESRTGSQVDPGSTVTDWTNQIAAAIQEMEDIILVQNNQPNSETNKIWIKPTSDEYQIPTWEEFSELKSAIAPLNGTYRNDCSVYDQYVIVGTSTSLRTAIISLKPNIKYRLKASGNNKFRVCLANQVYDGSQFSGKKIVRDDTLHECTFNSENYLYVYAYVSDEANNCPLILEAIPENFKDIRDELQANVEDLDEKINKTASSHAFNFDVNQDVYSIGTDGHFKRAYNENETMLPYLIDASGSSTVTDETVESDTEYPFTDYIKCKKYLLLCTKDTTSRIVIYFYTKSGDTYTINWSVKKINTDTGVRNYLSKPDMKDIITLPDNCYIRYSVPVGNVDVFTWDGEQCGISVASGIDYLATDGSVSVSTQNGRYTTVVPNNTLVVFTDSTIWMYTIIGIKADGSTEIINSEYGLTSYVFQQNTVYQSYMISIEWRESGKVIYNDLTGHLYVITTKLSQENIVGECKKIMNNAKLVNAIAWTPKDEMLLRRIGETELKFREGITYHGLPYGTKWDEPHLIGWHVSLHTFLNAINDANSIIYKEKIENSEYISAPWYGMVCSAYCSLICGFPTPNTNAGFLYNPKIRNGFDDNMPLGVIVSDGDHCVVPVEKRFSDTVNVVRIAESLKPLSTITTRYSNVSVEKNAFSHYNGDTYFDDMFYTARHKRMSMSLTAVPYMDLTDTTVTDGSARPYKGDKCVYTSEDSTVKINLVGSGINKLYLEKPDESVVEISITDETSVDVKSYLDADGIYHVYTNISNTKESFEYKITTGITVTITENSISFSDNDFWYAVCNVAGNEYLSRSGEIACVEKESNGDYSGWFANGQSITSCLAIFKKGTYGAYTVPVST